MPTPNSRDIAKSVIENSDFVDMKMSTKESKKMTEPCAAPSKDSPRYPYGLCIDLNNESLDKLKMATLPDVGDEVTITAKARVQSVSERDSIDGDSSRSVSLQITKLRIE